MRKITTILLLIISSTSILFASGLKEEKNQTVTEEKRIISLAPNITEIIFALDKQDTLKGRTNVCDYPQEALEIPDVGEIYNPSAEKIISLHPTDVITTDMTSADTVSTLKTAGINVHVLSTSETINGTYELIKTIGRITGAEKKADEIILEMREKIEDVKSRVSVIPENERKVCIYMISWGEFGDWCATGETYLGEIIEAAGGINCAGDSRNWQISREVLIKSDPDVIFLSDQNYMSAGADDFKKHEPYNQLTGEVRIINGRQAERQGVGTAETVLEMAKALYPELFN